MAQILEQYASTILLFSLALITVITFWALNKLLAPKRDMSKEIDGLSAFIAYECGEIPVGEAHSRFNFQYYVFALVFVVFDVVASFLVVWALVVKDLESPLVSMISVGVFLGILTIGFIYWWIRDALRWM